MNNDDELWYRLPQLSLRHVVPPPLWLRKPPNLSATKRKKRRLVTEEEEKRWKNFFTNLSKGQLCI